MHPLRNHIEKIVSISDSDFEIVLGAFRLKNLNKGQYTLIEGNRCTGDMFVMKGSLMQFFIDLKGKQHITQFAFADWWIGDYDSMLREQPSLYNIVAVEASQVLQIDYQKLEELFTDVPAMERYFRIIFQQSFAVQQRRIGWMQLGVRDRYLEMLKTYPQLERRVSQTQIASFLGITRESLSRMKANEIKLSLK